MADEITLTVSLPTDSITLTISDTLVGDAASSWIAGEEISGIKDGVNTTFTLANTPVTNSEIIVLGVTVLKRGTHYTINGNTITMITYIPEAEEIFTASYFKA